jgi:hypothetical protein
MYLESKGLLIRCRLTAAFKRYATRKKHNTSQGLFASTVRSIVRTAHFAGGTPALP